MSELPLDAVAIALVWAVGTAGAGAWLTTLGPWYDGLRKPSWQPPDRVFGPVWSAIFLLGGTAFVLGWRAMHDAAARNVLVATWAVNALLNVTWSLLFFRLRRPAWAVWAVAPLWLSIMAMISVVLPLSAAGALLLVPYLLWVSFAFVLNLAIVRLNEAPD
jgi:benzodiazapine receptor